MPELPEVETVAQTLKKLISGRTIEAVEILYLPIVKGDVSDFQKKSVGQKIEDLKRRGKYLLFILSDWVLVSHLRMEGKYFVVKKEDAVRKHTHVLFHLDHDLDLRYNDVRKFGRMEIIPKAFDYAHFKDLGPEPLSADFNPTYIYTSLKKRKQPLKQVLLDQHFVAGIGNIYADEILFAARIHPETIADRLTEKECAALQRETVRILAAAVALGGTTIRSYTSALGVHGRFQQQLCVHTKVGEHCPVCGSTIIKIRTAGRGTYLCPHCQSIKE